jgi:hypothetical protein
MMPVGAWGCVTAIDSNGRTIWIADAHRDGGRRFVWCATAEGTNALKNVTTGAGNTGVGWYSLFSDITGSLNSSVGAGTLVLNTGDENTATGAGALLSNTTSTENTAAILTRSLCRIST